MADLLAGLYAEIDRRETNAKAAAFCDGVQEPDWTAHHGMEYEVTSKRASVAFADTGPIADHIADNDPAHVLRGLAEDRDILRRHPALDERPYRKLKCRHDQRAGVSYIVDWPCAEIRSLARRLNVEVPS